MFRVSDVLLDKEEIPMKVNVKLDLDEETLKGEYSKILQLRENIMEKISTVLSSQGFPCFEYIKFKYKLNLLSEINESPKRYMLTLLCGNDVRTLSFELVAAHPMDGREVSGVENSTDRMFFGANYIVTPTEKNTPEAVETIIELGRLLGFSNVTTLSPEEHDEMIGFLSQLTHCIAITLMTCNDKENMEKFTGDSFRDLTRIARIDDLMWSELFVANKDVLLEQMNMFIGKFNDFKTMLERDDIDGMRAMMRHSTERRALFDKK